MIQDIAPSVLDNAYAPRPPREGDFLMCFDVKGALLSRPADGRLILPGCCGAAPEGCVWLFKVDGAGYFLAPGPAALPEGFAYHALRDLRPVCKGAEIFAAFTAYHLWGWYRDTRFCSRCGTALLHHDTQRAMRCPECGLVIYPRIYPAVIVGVIKGESLMITRYREGFRHNALVRPSRAPSGGRSWRRPVSGSKTSGTGRPSPGALRGTSSRASSATRTVTMPSAWTRANLSALSGCPGMRSCSSRMT